MISDDELREYVEPLAVELTARVNELLDLLACFVDESDCCFDHHGGCQEHGFLSLEPGETCPNEQAKRLLATRVNST